MAADNQGEPTVEHRKIRTKRGFRDYTYLGCPLTKNRTAWCFRICVPDTSGKGHCGRIAPHGLRGRTAIAIDDHRKQKLDVHCARLEHLYLSAPFNDLYEPGIRVEEGEAELVVPIRDALRLPSGDVAESVYLKVMNDAAVLAVNALVDERLVRTVRFEVQLTGRGATGDLIARGLVIARSGSRYQAQCVLTDADGMEIGRGEGSFEPGTTPLSPAVGYA